MAAEFPSNDPMTVDPPRQLARLAAARLALGRGDEAEALYRLAIDRLEVFCRDRPGHAEARTLLVDLYTSCPVERLRNRARARELTAPLGARRSNPPDG